MVTVNRRLNHCQPHLLLLLHLGVSLVDTLQSQIMKGSFSVPTVGVAVDVEVVEVVDDWNARDFLLLLLIKLNQKNM